MRLQVGLIALSTGIDVAKECDCVQVFERWNSEAIHTL
jgi:hypothetical protein